MTSNLDNTGLTAFKQPEKKHRLIEATPETPGEALMRKLEAWLMQQPEWVLLMMVPRPTRRAAAKAVASHLLTIPTRKRGDMQGGA